QASVRLPLRHREQAGIVDLSEIDSNSDVMKLVVGEQGIFLANQVTRRAIALVLRRKHLESSFRRSAERLLVMTVLPLVKGRVPADYGALEGCDALFDF